MSVGSGFTLEKLAALEAAIADGVLEVEYDDKKVKYRSLNEMIRIRDLMAEALCPKTTGKYEKVVVKTSKGTC